MITKSFIELVSLKVISPFKWTRLKFLITGREYDLTPKDRTDLHDLCETGIYMWLTRRETHLTTYLINFSDYLLGMYAWLNSGFTGEKPKLGFYSHAFMNADRDTFIEAVGAGVKPSYFDEVFDVDAVCALVPSGLSAVEWSMYSKKFVEVGKKKVGARYDTMFNLKDETEVSCIELIRVSLKHCMIEENYALRFANFEALIKLNKNLTPDMLRNCSDFTVVLEMRR